MKSVGVFEAKTRFSEICETVAAHKKEVTVTRRGKPFVRIVPIGQSGGQNKSIWKMRDEQIKRFGMPKEEFELPEREPQRWRDPLEE